MFFSSKEDERKRIRYGSTTFLRWFSHSRNEEERRRKNKKKKNKTRQHVATQSVLVHCWTRLRVRILAIFSPFKHRQAPTKKTQCHHSPVVPSTRMLPLEFVLEMCLTSAVSFHSKSVFFMLKLKCFSEPWLKMLVCIPTQNQPSSLLASNPLTQHQYYNTITIPIEHQKTKLPKRKTTPTW